MKAFALEPGLLSIFRFFTTLRLVLTVVVVGGNFDDDNVYATLNLVEVLLLAVYLWWPKLRERMGASYLPVAIALATIGPVVGQYFEFLTEFDKSGVEIVTETWQLTLVLFIPLILVGWQYHFRMVFFYCLGVALLDSALTLLSIQSGNPHTSILFEIILIRSLMYLLVGYIIAHLVASQREQRRDLAKANAKLLQYTTTLEQLATSRERNRLARELHDTLAHRLSGTAIQLEAAKIVWQDNPEQAQDLVEQSSVSIRSGMEETRRALQALRASPLDDLGLTIALRFLAESAAEQTGANLNWHEHEPMEQMSPAIEQAVYRIAQETLENMIKHANAKQLSVKFETIPGKVMLQIIDDGCGFDLEQVDEQYHFGLKGIRERAQMMGATLTIQSLPGEGTTIDLIMENNNDSRIDL